MRITIKLRGDEYQALVDLAREERRDPRDQAAIIIRQQLETLRRLPLAGISCWESADLPKEGMTDSNE